MRGLFDQQRSALEKFFQEVDLAATENLVTKLAACPGTIFSTGVGKSGYIAQKISATMTSLGIRARYLSPLDALHGDLGMVHQDDVVLFWSKSGSSQELVALVPFLRERGAYMVAIVAQKKTPLAKGAHFVVELPSLTELCPFDLAPTTSTVEQLLFGDAISIALSKKKEMAPEEFFQNHPGGFLGKKLRYKVEDVMLSLEKTPQASREERILDVLHTLSEKRCGCILVVDEKKFLLGIFTDGDLRRILESKGADALQVPLRDSMTKMPLSVEIGTLVTDALSRMAQKVTVLPVLEKGVLRGLLRMHDIIEEGFGCYTKE